MENARDLAGIQEIHDIKEKVTWLKTMEFN